MDEQQLKETIARNIAGYRKALNLTQAELAEKLNYSDKAVSKWERAEALPDIFILKQLSELYGITLDELAQPRADDKFRSKSRTFQKKIFVPLLSLGIVWLTAIILYGFLKMFSVPGDVWLIFIAALPASCIVCLVFSVVWWNHWFTVGLTSMLIWTVALLLFLTLSPYTGSEGIWFFVIAAVLQIMEILWSLFKKPPSKPKVKKEPPEANK